MQLPVFSAVFYVIFKVLSPSLAKLKLLIFIALFCFITGIIMGAVGIVLHTLNFRLLELSNTINKSQLEKYRN